MKDLLSFADLALLFPVVAIVLSIVCVGLFLGYRSRDEHIKALTELNNRNKRGRPIDE